MRMHFIVAAMVVAGCFHASSAQAACSGSNGRGWGSGNGNGKFEMTAADKSCPISFTNVIDDKAKTKIPATNVTVTKPPKSGKVAVTGAGLVYTPTPGFKGKDTFCTKNTTPKAKGVTFSGCITVSVK